MNIYELIKICLSILLTASLSEKSFSQQIIIDQLDQNIREEIPVGWIVRDTTTGDLNKDGKADFALVIQNDDEKNYKTDNDNFGYDSINANERLLLIFFKDVHGYKLINKTDGIIPEHVSPTMDDPYVRIGIDKGILQTGYYFWANAGSWLMYTTYYKFRYQNDDFYLIGIEHDSTHRGTMEHEKISINFSTRKAHITTIVPDGEEEKTTSEWKTFKLDNLYKISEVIPININILNKYL